jgi:hypothetical protein
MSQIITEQRFIHNDGGRAVAGFKGAAGDCVVRAVAIAAQLPYKEVYDALSDGCRNQATGRNKKRKSSAAEGVNTDRKWFKDYMRSIGFEWTPTMTIGSGCKVHLRSEELPKGRLVVSVSRHYVAVINGIPHDTHDSTRCGTRCVYGYWRLKAQ